MSSSSPNAGTQASAPLVDGIVNYVLLQSGPDLNQSLSHLVHVLHFFSGRCDLASLNKSCNLLGWDLGYSEATDQVRWMQASPVAAAWSSRVPCAPVHCLVGTFQVGSLLIILVHSSNWVRRWKNCENRSIFSKDMDMCALRRESHGDMVVLVEVYISVLWQ